jgi:anti-sigma factor RsiW
MPDENDRPLTEEEMAQARQGEALISAAVADVRAPQSLRESIERERERASKRERAPFWRRHRWALASAGTAAAVLAAAVIALETGSNTTEPSLGTVYAAARQSPTKAAPAPEGGSPPVVDAKVDSLVFPDWQRSFGWRAVGRRDDTLSGRRVTTVFYRNPQGARLGYAVVSGDALGANPPGQRVTRKGKHYYIDQAGGRRIVTWKQQGHTCAIVAPSALPQTRLVDLAASRNV